ncbi:MAG: HNH endonuclease [Planctomycetaceae bacterium]|nr:HNH endonuclease [Planctomycetaceae bacterium]
MKNHQKRIDTHWNWNKMLCRMTKSAFLNTLYTNDNLYVLAGLNSNLVDLIYLDPPFNSKRIYSATVGRKAAGASFKDMWTWKDVDEQFLGTLAVNYPALARYIADAGTIHSKAMMAYLTYMAQRMIEMSRILKDTGSLYLHCDPTASHYWKGLLDGIFGKNCFRNEIVWGYQWGGVGKRNFARKHDIIFWYSKSDDKENKWIFNDQAMRVPYTTKDIRWHNHEEGKLLRDIWEIPTINTQSKERVGYPTQKPLALLRRIINASSNEGDIVLDPFCGCATMCVAAQQLDRKWIGIDIEKQAAGILVERLSDDAGLFKDFIATDQIPKRSDIKEVQPTAAIKQRLYKEQQGKCNGCGVELELRHLEIDHIVPKAKGGGDYYENYQLLCGHCNRRKGSKPMEYLRMQIGTREKMLNQEVFFGE